MGLSLLNYTDRRAGRREQGEQRAEERHAAILKIENTIYDEVTGIYYADHKPAFLSLVMAGRESIAFESAVRQEAIETLEFSK